MDTERKARERWEEAYEGRGERDAEFGAVLTAVLSGPDLPTLIASAPAVMVGMSLGHLLRIAVRRARGTRGPAHSRD